MGGGGQAGMKPFALLRLRGRLCTLARNTARARVRECWLEIERKGAHRGEKWLYIHIRGATSLASLNNSNNNNHNTSTRCNARTHGASCSIFTSYDGESELDSY